MHFALFSGEIIEIRQKRRLQERFQGRLEVRESLSINESKTAADTAV